jgi:hypothetical protein
LVDSSDLIELDRLFRFDPSRRSPLAVASAPQAS